MYLEYQSIHMPAYFKMANLLRRQLHRLLSGWTICNVHVCVHSESFVSYACYYDCYLSLVVSAIGTVPTQIGQLGQLSALTSLYCDR